MNRARWMIAFSMISLLALTLACQSLFPPSDKTVRGDLKFDPPSMPAAKVGVPYEVEIKVSENRTPVGDFSIAPNTLPPGLELVIQKDVLDTAKITGTPTQAGTYTFTISVWCYGTNVSGQTGEKDYTIVVE